MNVPDNIDHYGVSPEDYIASMEIMKEIVIECRTKPELIKRLAQAFNLPNHIVMACVAVGHFV